MPNTKRNIFFNTIFVITDTVVNKMAFFIINIIIARYLTDVKFGEYATALGFATFFAMFSDIGINTTLVRMIIKDPEHEKEHITNAFLIKTVLGIISYTALCIGVYFVYYCRNESNIFYLTLIFGVVRVGNDYMNTFFDHNSVGCISWRNIFPYRFFKNVCCYFFYCCISNIFNL